METASKRQGARGGDVASSLFRASQSIRWGCLEVGGGSRKGDLGDSAASLEEILRRKLHIVDHDT